MMSEPQTTPAISKMFSDIAPTYDRLNRRLSFKQDLRWRDAAIKHITPKLSHQILDLCAGTLDMTVQLLKHFSHAQITAIDCSQEMLAQGAAKIPYVFRGQVTTQCQDAQQLDCADHTFDSVVCAFGIRNIPDQQRALNEIWRVLVPGGELVILEFFQPTTWFARLFANTYGRFVIPIVGGWLSHHRQAYRYLHESTANFFPLPAYRGLLRQHGFTIRAEQALTGGVATIVVAEKAGRPA